MTETWKKVPGFDLYEVSDLGSVRVLDQMLRVKGGATRLAKGRVLKLSTVTHGYLGVTLYRDGWPQKFTVHRLVMLAFVGPRPDGCQIAHGNGDRKDNRLANLRYATIKENMADMRKHGTWPEGEKAGYVKLTAEQVRSIREDKRTSVALGKVYGVCGATIRAIRLGKIWKSLQ